MTPPLKTDVAIIGGGLAGCSTALHLRQRGASVVLLERALCGSQASGVNYGGVRQQGRTLVELPISRRARALWGRLAEIVGTDCEFMATGHLKLARSEADMAELETYATAAADWGLKLQLFGRNAIRDRYPWAGDRVIGGSLCADDGQANPRLVAPAFARRARALGADIREHAHVTHVEKGSDGFRLATADGLEVHAQILVNVAGAWGHEIAARFGEVVPEEAISPNMCVTEPVPYFLVPNLGVVGGDLYMRQIPRGNVIFGGGRGVNDAAAQRARPEPDGMLTAFQRAVEVAPGLRGVQVIRTWTGIEGNMPDELPIIDRSRTTPGLIHAFGFSGHGFQLGPAVGAIVAELALDGVTETAIAPFGIGRFTGQRAG
jgi:sarcosine oxidase subunit beta